MFFPRLRTIARFTARPPTARSFSASSPSSSPSSLRRSSPLLWTSAGALALAAAATTSFLLFDDKNDNDESVSIFRRHLLLEAQKQERGKSSYFTRQQVAEHRTKEQGIWVTFGSGVYDISDFVAHHPGGEKILLAAGGPVEPYWKVYTIHDSPAVRKLLAPYKIGELDPRELENASPVTSMVDVQDPFSNDPVRSPILVVRSQKPFNAETPPALLLDAFVTPTELFYTRHHLPVPDPRREEYALTVETKEKTLRFTLSDLEKLPQVEVMATLQCAGNRRAEMKVAGPVQGLSWDRGAIGNAIWKGVRLRDVFAQAGITEAPAGTEHVQFEGLDGYGASIPISTAFRPEADVVLALEMNGAPLPRDHGFPVRVVIPGTVAARSVKWLSKIIFSEEESRSHWQRNDYKGFSPSADWDRLDYSKADSIQEMPVQSAIVEPNPGSKLAADAEELTVRGYAWSGGGRGISRVDVSIDGGKTWQVAELVEKSQQPRGRIWAWVFWEAQIDVPRTAERVELVCKATDTSYNTQPDSFEGIYNRRGVLSNAWQRFVVEREKGKE